MTDRDRLRELAEKATPGPWIRPWGANYLHGMTGDFDPAARQEDLDYIAAASPDVILVLLEERRVLRERVRVLEDNWPSALHDPSPQRCHRCGGVHDDPAVLRRINRAALQERTEATR